MAIPLCAKRMATPSATAVDVRVIVGGSKPPWNEGSACYAATGHRRFRSSEEVEPRIARARIVLEGRYRGRFTELLIVARTGRSEGYGQGWRGGQV